MDTYEESLKRAELLKTARSLTNEEYISKREADYNTWLVDCEREWKENRIKLPYPVSAPLPTEEDIVARALALYNASIVPPVMLTNSDIPQEVLDNIDPEIVSAAQRPLSTWEQFVNPLVDISTLGNLPALSESVQDVANTNDNKIADSIIAEPTKVDVVSTQPNIILNDFRDNRLAAKLKAASLLSDDNSQIITTKI